MVQISRKFFLAQDSGTKRESNSRGMVPEMWISSHDGSSFIFVSLDEIVLEREGQKSQALSRRDQKFDKAP